MPNPAFWEQFGPENKLIEGQPNEYYVICRNASVLAVHPWPTIFAGAPFRLQNICRNASPHHYTPSTTVNLPNIFQLITLTAGGGLGARPFFTFSSVYKLTYCIGGSGIELLTPLDSPAAITESPEVE